MIMCRVSHRNPTCWCGASALPKRSTCCDEHARGAHKGRPRNYDRRCACGAPALPKRATCSDACAEARRATGRKRTRPIKEPKSPKPPRLCRCGERALPGRRTCSDVCALAAQRPPGRGASVRARRRADRQKAYRRSDKAAVSARMTAEQGGRCLVCATKSRLVLDHCHTTGEPRAMLCGRCNAALGLMLESVTAIEALKCYAELCDMLRS
jgi:hypothetical protein